MARKIASLNPDDFIEGGGLVDDVDVTFTECIFDMFDYNKTVVPGVPSLKITMEVEGEEVVQYYSVGSSDDWVPSDDGSRLEAVGRASNIRVTTNAGIFLKSLIDAGFPVDKLGNDVRVLNGLEAHMIRVPAPKRPGMVQRQRADGREYEKTILVVSEILNLPGEKKSAVKKDKATEKKAAVTPEESDVNSDAITAVLSILESEGTITKRELPGKIFQTEKNNPNRNAIVKTVFVTEFLESGPWTYENETLTL